MFNYQKLRKKRRVAREQQRIHVRALLKRCYRPFLQDLVHRPSPLLEHLNKSQLRVGQPNQQDGQAPRRLQSDD